MNPDFRSVILQWGGAPELEIARRIESVEGAGNVLVSYCELQAWGPYRCREKVHNFKITHL